MSLPSFDVELRTTLQHDPAPQIQGWLLGIRDGLRSEEELLDDVLRLDGFAKRESLEPERMVEVHADEDWRRLVKAAQASALERFTATGLAVEINPTSNLAIGDFAAFSELPYLSTANPGAPPKVPLVVGTDNPGLMQTTLRREYENIAPGLKELNWSPSRAREWIENLRQRSREQCFIPSWAPRGASLGRHVTYLLE